MKLTTKVFLALLIGAVAGATLNSLGQHEGRLMEALDTGGKLFLRLLKMVIVPLIFTSIVHAVAGLGDLRKLTRIGARTFVYYFTTTGIAVFLGLAAVNLARPGVGADRGLKGVPERLQEQGPPSVSDLLLRVIPENPVDALARTDVLQIIFFALVLGVALGMLGAKGQRTREVIEELNDAILLIIGWVLKLVPYGVALLMTRALGRAGLDVFLPLLKYLGTVIGALAVHALLVYPFALIFLAKVKPLQFFRGVSEALVTAFSTSSSSATLPVTMRCLQENVGVSERVSFFVLPIGATVNMDGTALYEAVAAMFIAQAYGIDLTLTQQLLVFLTATLAAIGAAGIPEAGLFTMVIVLNAVGLPTEGIGLILAVDRILDMCRTTVNVLGDTVGATLVARLEGELNAPD